MLRHVGCQLPVEFWYQGSEEMDERMLGLIRQLNVECVDASALASSYPRRVAGGWELKSYALLHSSFKEVLLLDADNVPIRDPAFLFEEPAYKATGSIFWPDYGCLEPDRAIWSICALE